MAKSKHVCSPTKKGQYAWPCRECHPKYYSTVGTTRWYVYQVVGDVEPELKGPFTTEFNMEKAARRLKEQNGDQDGLFWILQEGLRLDTGSWPGGFFEKEGADE